MAERLLEWRELDDRGARQGPQVIGPQQLQHGVRQLWQVILQLEAQLGGEEGKSLHQPFDVRVAATFAQQPGKLWVVGSEVVAQFMQVTQLFAESILE